MDIRVPDPGMDYYMLQLFGKVFKDKPIAYTVSSVDCEGSVVRNFVRSFKSGDRGLLGSYFEKCLRASLFTFEIVPHGLFVGIDQEDFIVEKGDTIFSITLVVDVRDQFVLSAIEGEHATLLSCNVSPVSGCGCTIL
jgi:hypothetical protein